MKKDRHAEKIVSRFRQLVETAGHSLDDGHYEQLTLLVEAGIDAALLDKLEKVADKLQILSHAVRHDAEFFER